MRVGKRRHPLPLDTLKEHRMTLKMNDVEQIDVLAHPQATAPTVIVAINNPRGEGYSTVYEGTDLPDALRRAAIFYRHYEPDVLPVVAMTADQYDRHYRSLQTRRLDESLKASDEEDYDEKLGVVPPYWQGVHNGITGFLMGEPYDHGVYLQCGHIGKLYARKLVIARKRDTWLTGDEIRRANAIL